MAVGVGLAGASVQTKLQKLERQKAVLQSETAQVKMALNAKTNDPIDVRGAMALFRRTAELFPSA
jgi:uncharacterized small protein (DUF1192 family)